jgi:hypothetical protein
LRIVLPMRLAAKLLAGAAGDFTEGIGGVLSSPVIDAHGLFQREVAVGKSPLLPRLSCATLSGQFHRGDQSKQSSSRVFLTISSTIRMLTPLWRGQIATPSNAAEAVCLFLQVQLSKLL